MFINLCNFVLCLFLSILVRHQDKTLLRINLPLFSTVVPAIIFVFLSCRPFVAITTLSTGLVSVEVDNVVIATKGLQDRNTNIIAGTTVENKGKLILTEIFPSVQKHDIF